MCAPSLCSPTLLGAQLSPRGSLESGRITGVVPRHRDPAKRAGAERRGCFADPEPWSPREGSRWGIASCLSPRRCPVKSSLPERLGRDGTSLLSGLIAHVRCIYRSDCLCRAQQTNRLLFCQAPFVIGGGLGTLQCSHRRPRLYPQAPTPRRAGGARGIQSPGSGGRGQPAAPRHCSPSPTSDEQAEGSQLAPSRANRTHKANPSV